MFMHDIVKIKTSRGMPGFIWLRSPLLPLFYLRKQFWNAQNQTIGSGTLSHIKGRISAVFERRVLGRYLGLRVRK